MVNKTQIAALASHLESKEDLLEILNLIKKEEMEKEGLGAYFHPFTIRHINYYCNPNHVFHRYKQFKIPKKMGGERCINAPRNRSFKLILRYLNQLLKALYLPSDSVCGFVEGRSVVTNASKHVGKKYVFNTDLMDFFPSIEQPRVWKRLQLPPFNFHKAVANVVAGLCSMKEEVEGKVKYVLPQGAPTSPIITNMICDNLDRRLRGLAKRFGLSYSRYADDITFSSDHYVYSLNGDFRKELDRIISSQGFRMNPAKTRLQKRGERQEVTGLTVNELPNVTRKYVREIRDLLYIWDRYGYGTAMLKFIPRYGNSKGKAKSGNPDLANVLEGKLMYLKMVKGSSNPTYLSLYAKFRKLSEALQAMAKTNSYGISYLQTMPLIYFESKNLTKIEIKLVSGDEGECSERKHRFARFVIGGKTVVASVNKRLTADDEKHRDKLSISFCKDAKGNRFWLIHKTNNAVSFQADTSFDSLNKNLDKLLAEYE